MQKMQKIINTFSPINQKEKKKKRRKKKDQIITLQWIKISYIKKIRFVKTTEHVYHCHVAMGLNMLRTLIPQYYHPAWVELVLPLERGHSPLSQSCQMGQQALWRKAWAGEKQALTEALLVDGTVHDMAQRHH